MFIMVYSVGNSESVKGVTTDTAIDTAGEKKGFLPTTSFFFYLQWHLSSPISWGKPWGTHIVARSVPYCFLTARVPMNC